MSFKLHTLIAAAAATLCVGAAQSQTINGFSNGGFEVGAPASGVQGPADDWLTFNSGYTLSNNARTGSFAAQLSSEPFKAAVMVQNSIAEGGLAPLVVGDTPTFSFWAKGFAGSTGNVLFALRYLDGTGNILGDSGNQYFQTALNETTYTQFTYNLGPVPVGAIAAFVEFSQGIGPIGPGPAGEVFKEGKVWIDDVYLGVTAPVPEPSSYAMLLIGLGVAGAMARRNRRTA